MEPTDLTNKYFDIAVKFVNQTSKHIFLTGKAGTGKTTFLKYIKESSHKKMAIIAPTGVAAMNAGGTTIHSFFQLPLTNFLPLETRIHEGNFHNRQSLLQHLRLKSTKRRLIQELDLLVIDEVSMLRADLLDAIDIVLRHIRRQPHIPFGGVQMLYIGDLFQLPPVINDDAWSVLNNFYSSPFFFHAHALKQAPPLYLELKKIYRQSDEVFIRLLNNLRNNTLSKDDINLLNKYYNPNFKPEANGDYITLTTHNFKADQINKEELEKLPGKLYTYDAEIIDDFNEKSSPAENKLHLKVGAQIMFIRNDKGETSRYYNGKVGTVKRIEGKEIYVTFPGEHGELLVEKETWKNIRYKYITEADTIEEETLGTFTQYPIRLAWAITIHKSQGLTFNKAIVDAGSSFAPGQVYVALSRLRSLDGLILYSPINPNVVNTDKEAIAFASTEADEETISGQLELSQKTYFHDILIDAFSWRKIVDILEIFLVELDERRLPSPKEAKLIFTDLVKKSKDLLATGEKFSRQLEKLLVSVEHVGYEQVYARVEAATKYFSTTLLNELLTPLKSHYEKVKGQKKVKKYLKDIQVLLDTLENKGKQIEKMEQLVSNLLKGIDTNLLFQQIVADKNASKSHVAASISEKSIKEKLPKGGSQKLSLDLFKGGKTIPEIAKERGLAVGTIESHLITFINTGEINLKDFVLEEKIHAIKEAIETLDEVSATAIKEKLGDTFSYAEIRAVIKSNVE